MKDPEKRAKDIIGVVVDDPDVSQDDEEEIIQAALELADDLCLYKETEEEIKDLAPASVFKTGSEAKKQNAY